MGSVTLAVRRGWRIARRGRGARRMTVAIAAACAACTGQTVNLGDRDPRPYHFETPKLVPELASTARTDNPTLTADLMEIYFTSDRMTGNGGDVWFARRYDTRLPFSNPLPVDEVNTATFETSSAISADGLTLWFGSDRPGSVGMDIWVSGRPTRNAAWLAPSNVVALNTIAEDIPRPPGQHGLVMPLASTFESPLNYQTYLSARPGAGAPFGAPALIAELAHDDRSTVDAFLSDDGLTLFYASAANAIQPDGGASVTADLYVAWRLSTSETFSVTQPLEDLNTPADERDPWLTPDGRTLYFTSDRDGVLSIYTAAVKSR